MRIFSTFLLLFCCCFFGADAQVLGKQAPSIQYHLKSKPNKNIAISIYTNYIDSCLLFFKQEKISNYTIVKGQAFINATINKAQINLLSQNNYVYFIDAPLKAVDENIVLGYDKKYHGINKALANLPNNNGNNIVVGVKENKFNYTNADLLKRIVNSNIASNTIDPHANDIATLIAGAGNTYHTSKGMAYKAQLFSSSYANLMPDNINDLQLANVSLQNHSYGAAIQNYYTPEANAYDAQLWNNKNLLHVFSSGNSGKLTSNNGTYNGIANYANITGGFKQAKNIITVGGLDSAGNTVDFSSRGPLYDGRIAPQIMALGATGTSDAAALVSSTIALLQQSYKDSNANNLPAAHLIKALLFNNATHNKYVPISYQYGYGSLNVLKTLDALKNKQYYNGVVANANTWSTNISIPSQIATAYFTLQYTDSTQSVNSVKALINNLDFELYNPSTNTTILPWVLNPSQNKDSLTQSPKQKVDTLNTTEQIIIKNPIAGNYILRVKGSKITSAPTISFSVAYSYDTLQSFQFTNPINADDIDNNESNTLAIKWQNVLADSNSVGNLQVAYNNSSTWVTIANSIALKNEGFNWVLPSQNSQIQFKMQTAFGDFYSNKVMLHTPTRFNILYNCTDSAKINWPSHQYATSYTILTLIDSAYLKPIATINDTSFLINKNQFNSSYFAVKPNLPAPLFATQSELLNISEQGVYCFYSNLVANEIGNSINLELQLSYPQIIKNISFQKVDNSNNIISNLGSQLVNNNILFYNAQDANKLSGANNYRAKLTLQNNSTIYTNTVSVTSAGKKAILLYPTLVKRGQKINYKQLEAFENGRLVFYNIAGQQVKTVPVGTNGEILTNNFSPSVYLYLFLAANGKKIEKGRIIVE